MISEHNARMLLAESFADASFDVDFSCMARKIELIRKWGGLTKTIALSGDSLRNVAERPLTDEEISECIRSAVRSCWGPDFERPKYVEGYVGDAETCIFPFWNCRHSAVQGDQLYLLRVTSINGCAQSVCDVFLQDPFSGTVFQAEGKAMIPVVDLQCLQRGYGKGRANPFGLHSSVVAPNMEWIKATVGTRWGQEATEKMYVYLYADQGKGATLDFELACIYPPVEPPMGNLFIRGRLVQDCVLSYQRPSGFPDTLLREGQSLSKAILRAFRGRKGYANDYAILERFFAARGQKLAERERDRYYVTLSVDHNHFDILGHLRCDAGSCFKTGLQYGSAKHVLSRSPESFVGFLFRKEPDPGVFHGEGTLAAYARFWGMSNGKGIIVGNQYPREDRTVTHVIRAAVPSILGMPAVNPKDWRNSLVVFPEEVYVNEDQVIAGPSWTLDIELDQETGHCSVCGDRRDLPELQPAFDDYGDTIHNVCVCCIEWYCEGCGDRYLSDTPQCVSCGNYYFYCEGCRDYDAYCSKECEDEYENPDNEGGTK